MIFHKSKIYTALLVLIVLALGVVVYSFNSKQESKTDNIEPQSFWSTYTNDFIKVSFNYPSEWYINEDASRVNLVISDYIGGIDTSDEKITQDHIRILFMRTGLLQNQTIDTYVSRGIPSASSEAIKQQEEIFVGDMKAKEYIFDLGGGKLIRGIYIQNGRTLYSFSIAPADSKQMSIFDQMLQSFHVLE